MGPLCSTSTLDVIEWYRCHENLAFACELLPISSFSAVDFVNNSFLPTYTQNVNDCVQPMWLEEAGSGRSLPLKFCIHVHSGPIYWGVIYLAKKIIRWWHFTCKKPENIICDGILHVNMFHYFKIPYFTCIFFTKFTYNEYIGPYFFIARCSMIFAQWSPWGTPWQQLNLFNIRHWGIDITLITNWQSLCPHLQGQNIMLSTSPP
jgi:hypothetical protein